MKKYLLPGLAGLCLIAAATLAITFRPNTETVLNNDTRYTPIGYGSTFGPSAQRRGGMMRGFQSQRTSPVLTIDTDLSGSDYDATSLKAVLDTVLADERNALAEYTVLLDTFGNSGPWTRLIQAETRHVTELERIYTAFNLEVPVDTSPLPASVPGTLDEAYQIGIEAETANIALYDGYLNTRLPKDVATIFSHLQNASLNHLAIFQNGVDGTGWSGCPGYSSGVGRWS